eukprot:1362257-Amphidinium_carterae.1
MATASQNKDAPGAHSIPGGPLSKLSNTTNIDLERTCIPHRSWRQINSVLVCRCEAAKVLMITTPLA